MDARPQLVVGTAGHIDHGKSRLVLALTGTDPDRLPEEKARGMTIDLGFAHASFDGCDVWFVDVPGHERFVRNMVAGATGIDLALFVVAADDSVMPQTREHAELLALLGVSRVVIVVTKMDLVDDEWAEQVEAEAREVLAGAGIAAVQAVRVSAQSGRGILELKALLRDAAVERGAAQRGAFGWFRMPVDRAFLVAGRGTVVTGSVAHGQIERGAELELWPDGRRVRVRDLQSHNEAREQASGRMRLALNLAGVGLDEVQRGCELATPGYLAPTRCLDVRVSSLRRPGRRTRARLRARLHIATSEISVELLLAQPADDERIHGAFAQLRTAQPLVATYGQRFILRDDAGQQTLGGGLVLRPQARPWTARRPADLESLQRLLEAAEAQRIAELLRISPWQALSAAQLASASGLPDAAAARAACDGLLKAGVVRELEAGAAPILLHRDVLTHTAIEIVRRIERHLKKNPLSPGIPLSEWPAWMPRLCPQTSRSRLAEWMLKTGRFVVDNGYVLPQGSKLALSKEDQALSEAILAEIQAGGFSPPAISALRCIDRQNPKRVGQIVNLAAARGRLVRLEDQLWMHAEQWQRLVSCVTEAIRARGGLSVAQIRDLLGSSRKYVVPIVEKLDALGVTRRNGDLRELPPGAN